MTFPSKRNRFAKAEFATEEQRDLYDFMYVATLGHETPQGTFLWGQAMAHASEHPDWTFWRVVEELRKDN